MGRMDDDILKVLYTEEEIAARIREMGAAMYRDLEGKDPLFISVLRGAFVFMADIVRACQVRSDVEFIAVSSYGSATKSSGAVQIPQPALHRRAEAGGLRGLTGPSGACKYHYKE